MCVLKLLACAPHALCAPESRGVTAAPAVAQSARLPLGVACRFMQALWMADIMALCVDTRCCHPCKGCCMSTVLQVLSDREL